MLFFADDNGTKRILFAETRLIGQIPLHDKVRTISALAIQLLKTTYSLAHHHDQRAKLFGFYRGVHLMENIRRAGMGQ